MSSVFARSFLDCFAKLFIARAAFLLGVGAECLIARDIICALFRIRFASFFLTTKSEFFVLELSLFWRSRARKELIIERAKPDLYVAFTYFLSFVHWRDLFFYSPLLLQCHRENRFYPIFPCEISSLAQAYLAFPFVVSAALALFCVAFFSVL